MAKEPYSPFNYLGFSYICIRNLTITMNKKIIISFFCLLLAHSSSMIAASYPTKGYTEGPSYIEVFVPTNESSTNLLGATYDLSTLGDYTLNLGGDDYIVHDDFIFQEGDSISFGADTWELIAPDYSDPTYSSLYGYILLDIDGDGNIDGDDTSNPPLGGLTDLFYALPIGNGELVFIFLILSYISYILYRKRKALKTKKVEA